MKIERNLIDSQIIKVIIAKYKILSLPREVLWK